ncbi:hypothetical protein DNTS_001289 [Danionella cerebrum]|uniref:Ig-like domain-containing protein n=1 Tax=Danionella cerebrum TaxID=2873325 RepID=A0A553Q3N2_9TELE|nr:hypothetical protein DNTS_001289 [Danionella translucida]
MEFKVAVVVVFWAATAAATSEELRLEADQPLQRVPISHDATVRCCFRWKKRPQVTWIMNIQTINHTTVPRAVDLSQRVKHAPAEEKHEIKCHKLVLSSVRLEDTGLYQCMLNHSTLLTFSHGTFLQVFIPLQKTLNLSESVKNSILTAEGVLLLLCVLFPGTVLLCKTRRLNELQRRKGREEENIYEGLNLDDCTSEYHQIQRRCRHDPYEDVAS